MTLQQVGSKITADMKNLKEYAKEFARSGGLKTLEKYGKEHFKKLAIARWEKEKRENLK